MCEICAQRGEVFESEIGLLLCDECQMTVEDFGPVFFCMEGGLL